MRPLISLQMITGQIKSTVRQVAAGVYYSSRHFLKRLQGKVLILTYHRVLSEKEIDQYFIQPGIYVQKDVFNRQMEFLKEHFSILSFAELLDLWNRKALERDQRYCVITFDDGWLDNYIYAYPILKRYNIPATIFLPTALIGTNQWFWTDKISYILGRNRVPGVGTDLEVCPYNLGGELRLKPNTRQGFSDKTHTSLRLTKEDENNPPIPPLEKGGKGGFERPFSDEEIDLAIETCKGLPEEEIHDLIVQMSKNLNLNFPEERMLINWNEIEEMSGYGITFGSHSCTHKILTKLTPEERQWEIEDSLNILRDRKINYIPVFCYPNGDYNEEIMRQVKTAGYQAAVSTYFGFEGGSPQDLFCLRRISIHNDITATIPLFVFHISGMNQLTSFA